MWTIRRNHQHIEPDTLTEYLDGRLVAGALARVDRQLATCAACREELESLRDTIVLLRELPMEVPRRSFTMAAPPPDPGRARPSPLLRVPQWAFAGGASVAAIILAVLVTVDASLFLASGDPLATPAPALSQRAPEESVAEGLSLARDDGTSSKALATAAPAAAQPSVAKRTLVLPTPSPLALAAEAAPAPPPSAAIASTAEGPVAGQAEAAMAPPEPAPLARAFDAPAEVEAEPLGADGAEPETSLAAKPPPRAAAEHSAREDQPATGSELLAKAERIPEAGSVFSESPGSETEGTGVFWSVLEGLVALILALFLAGFVFRMIVSRRVDPR